jgi:predicted oxidoreductase
MFAIGFSSLLAIRELWRSVNLKGLFQSEEFGREALLSRLSLLPAQGVFLALGLRVLRRTSFVGFQSNFAVRLIRGSGRWVSLYHTSRSVASVTV